MTRLNVLIVSTLLVLTVPGEAGLQEDVFTCSGITPDAERLSCFDAAAKLAVSRMLSDPENAILKQLKKPKQEDLKPPR